MLGFLILTTNTFPIYQHPSLPATTLSAFWIADCIMSKLFGTATDALAVNAPAAGWTGLFASFAGSSCWTGAFSGLVIAGSMIRTIAPKVGIRIPS